MTICNGGEVSDANHTDNDENGSAKISTKQATEESTSSSGPISGWGMGKNSQCTYCHINTRIRCSVVKN